METQGSPVRLKMAVEVVPQKPGKLVRSLNVGAGRHQVTTRQAFVKVGIVSAVKLVDDHLPNGVASGGASLRVAVAFVRHPVVQGVGPDGNAAQGSGDGSVVDEELIGHHFELLVPTHPKEGSPDANDGSVSDVGKAFHNEPVSGHFGQPVIVRSIGPVFGLVAIGNGEDSDLVASTVKLLHGRVVGVLVRNVVGSLERAAVRILPFAVEDLLEQVNVVRVDSTVESDGDHLRNLSGINVARHPGAIR